MEAFSAAYRTELKPFGIDVVIAAMRDIDASSPGSAKGLTQLDEGMTAAQRKLYGKLIRVWTEKLAQDEATADVLTAAKPVVDLAVQEQVPVRADI